jgi:hypothetical protein
MSEAFDPYHRWLGIPPEQQPPDHYRLLGIARFEADREVIDSVAMRHMGFLQEITDGPHVKDAQQLLNQLAAARRCLLDPDRKTAYDAQLRLQRSDSTPTPPPVTGSADLSDLPSIPGLPTGPRRAAASRRQASRSATGRGVGIWLGFARLVWRAYRLPITVTAIGLFALVVAAAWFAGSRPHREPQTLRTGPQAVDHVAPDLVPELPDLADPAEVGDRLPASPLAAVGTGPSSQVPMDSGNVNAALPAPALDAQPPATLAEKLAPAPPLQLDGLMLWLDAADRTTVGLDSASRVSTWTDKGERNFQAKADNAASRPAYVEQALGDHPVLQFAEPASLAIAGTTEPLNLGSHYTILYVARGTEGSLLSKGSGDSPGSFAWTRGVAGLRMGGASFAVPGDTGLEARVRVVHADQDQFRWFIDGHAHHPAAQTGFEVQTRNVVRLGAVLKGRGDTQHFFQGQLAELLVYNRALDDGERKTLEDYLSGKWLHGSDAPEPLTVELAATIAENEPAEDVWQAGSDAGADAFEPENAGWEMPTEAEPPAREAASGREAEPAAAVPGSGAPEIEEASDEPFVLFANLGGGAYQDQDGNQWQESKKHGVQDFGHEGGMSAGKTFHPFPNLLWAETAIRGLTAFRAAVPNGVYQVTLCFCDQWTSDVTRRSFYTVWERGHPHALRRVFHGPGIGGPWTHVERRVLVRDGQLDIEFSPLTEGSFAILNGIIIRQISDASGTGRRR